LLLWIHAEHEDRQRRTRLAQLLEHVEPAPARQRDVQDEDVPTSRPRRGEDLLAVRRLPEDRAGDGGLEDLLQAQAHDGMIVGQEDAGHGGIVTSTVVPLAPAAAFRRNTTSPPSARARSRMPSRPSDRESAAFSGGIPCPSSITWRTMRPPSAARLTSTAVAPAWRATLVSASWRMRK